MWQRTAVIVALGLVWAPRARLPGEEIRYAELLISDLNWVMFDVTMGRILATGNRTRHNQQRTSRELPDGTIETFAVTLDRGLVSLHYAYQGATRRLVVHVTRRDHLEIEYRCHDESAPITLMRFVQHPGDHLSLVLQAADETPCEYRAATLWHLQLAYPEACRTPLNCMLRALRPDWQIEDEIAEIRSTLLASEPSSAATSRREVELLVAQLSADQFRTRQAAARELLARGRCVLGFLQELDLTMLDAEQRQRVGDIQKALTVDRQDTPARVTAWLVNDRRTWLALMNDDQLQHRTRAHSHLMRLCDRPVDFDPEAAPETRAAQLAHLHTALLRR